MKRTVSLAAVFFLLMASAVFAVPSSLLALEAHNVQVRMEGSRATVTFDIPGDQPVDVDVVFSDHAGRLQASPGALTGDVGKAVSPGKTKRIHWEFLKDHPYGLASRTLNAGVTLTGGSSPEPAATRKEDKMPKIEIVTSHGTIIAELDSEKAPLTVENILTYARDGFYDGTIFHRVIDGFMIQGGGFDKDMNQKATRPPVKNEAGNGLKNVKGTLAMARTSVVDSATSQFFINLVDNGFLDHKNPTPSGFGYAVFGRVVEGMDVVEAIGKVDTGNYRGFQDVPSDPVVIEKVTVIE